MVCLSSGDFVLVECLSALLQPLTTIHFSVLYVQVRDEGRWLILLSTVSPKCPVFHILWALACSS